MMTFYELVLLVDGLVFLTDELVLVEDELVLLSHSLLTQVDQLQQPHHLRFYNRNILHTNVNDQTFYFVNASHFVFVALLVQ